MFAICVSQGCRLVRYLPKFKSSNEGQLSLLIHQQLVTFDFIRMCLLSKQHMALCGE